MISNRLLRALFPPALILAIVAFSPLLTSQVKRPMEIEDLFRLKRVSDPQLSPDGKMVAFVITEVDKPSNKSNSDIWLIPSGGGEARRFTNSPKHDRHPRWSPDGTQIVFSSAMGRNPSFATNTRLAIVPVDGGTPRSVTDSFDESPGLIEWRQDGIYFSALQKTAAHLFRLDPATGNPQYSNFVYINQFESSAWSNYNSLQVKATQRLSKGMDFLVAYTLSKSITTVDDAFGWGGAGSLDAKKLSLERALALARAGPRAAGDRRRVVPGSVS